MTKINNIKTTELKITPNKTKNDKHTKEETNIFGNNNKDDNLVSFKNTKKTGKTKETNKTDKKAPAKTEKTNNKNKKTNIFSGKTSKYR